MTEIHDLSLERERRATDKAVGNSSEFPIGSPPISFTERLVNRILGEESESPRPELSQDALIARHDGKLDVWMTLAACELGDYEPIKSMLEAKLNLVKSILQAAP